MRLTDDRTGSALLVRSYAPGEVRVADKVLQRSCLISAERLIEDWRPQTLDELTEADFQAVFELQPEIVVLGSGPRQRFPEPPELGRPLPPAQCLLVPPRSARGSFPDAQPQ